MLAVRREPGGVLHLRIDGVQARDLQDVDRPYLATGFLFEAGDSVVILVVLAAFDVPGPGDDIDFPFPLGVHRRQACCPYRQ